MPYIIGISLAIAVGAFGRWIRMDRDAAFYPTMLILVASYYVLFAVMGHSLRATAVEVCIAIAFVAAAAIGFRTNLWLIVAGLAGHGVFDCVHGSIIANTGVPSWWPAFCLAFDIAAAASLAALLLLSSRSVKPTQSLFDSGYSNANRT
ncbi:MAG TPA: hypothetical protein VGM82_23710 [Gemmatimonadaceae bacterium]|jgi:hypothetical protein